MLLTPLYDWQLKPTRLHALTRKMRSQLIPKNQVIVLQTKHSPALIIVNIHQQSFNFLTKCSAVCPYSPSNSADSHTNSIITSPPCFETVKVNPRENTTNRCWNWRALEPDWWKKTLKWTDHHRVVTDHMVCVLEFLIQRLMMHVHGNQQVNVSCISTTVYSSLSSILPLCNSYEHIRHRILLGPKISGLRLDLWVHVRYRGSTKKLGLCESNVPNISM